MSDKEFLERLQVLLNNLMLGMGRLSDVDFPNLNTTCIELERRLVAAGAHYNAKKMEYRCAPVQDSRKEEIA